MSKLTYLENLEELKNNKDYNCFVLDFTASWCGPCQMITPEIEKLANMEDFVSVKFYKVDVDNPDCEDVCSNYGITCMPTFIYIKNGEVIDKVEGANLENIVGKLMTNFGVDNSNSDDNDSPDLKGSEIKNA
tara:strand:- start:74 stop:469 length:396 start_codon:yes stop_codon:yes gene_type:complete